MGWWRPLPRRKGVKGCGWECQNCEQIYVQRKCPADCSNCSHRKGYMPRWIELRGAGEPRVPARKRLPAVTQSRRELIFERDDHRCVNCAVDDRDLLTLDHIRPKSKGGSNQMDNLQTLCRDCNGLKADIVPPPGETFPPQLLAA